MGVPEKRRAVNAMVRRWTSDLERLEKLLAAGKTKAVKEASFRRSWSSKTDWPQNHLGKPCFTLMPARLLRHGGSFEAKQRHLMLH